MALGLIELILQPVFSLQFFPIPSGRSLLTNPVNKETRSSAGHEFQLCAGSNHLRFPLFSLQTVTGQCLPT